MVNSERNLTLLQQSIPPAGQARPDWQLICQVAAQMGYREHFRYESAEQIFDEIRRFANPKTGYDLRGASYARLRQTPLQWPCPPDDDADRHPIRYLNDGVSQDLFIDENGHRPRLAFPTPSRRAVFHARPDMDPSELPDDDFPLVLNTGRLQHQWHTMTKTGKVAKLNKLNSGPFVEVHPVDAVALDIMAGQPVELTSRRGRAVLPAVVTDRVRPGNCFVPFHWNDEHGEYLTINALTNDAVDADSLQPEYKVCAVHLRPARSVDTPGWAHPLAAELGLIGVRRPTLTDGEKIYLAAFVSGLADGVTGVPLLPPSASVAPDVRMWIDGLLAGRYSRKYPTANLAPAQPGRGPLVLWASQTGNAEDFAARLAGRVDGSQLVNMNDLELADLAAAREVLVVTSTFGDGGPPDNGADFWDRLESPDAPALDGVRYAVLGIGDRSYDNFCGHARSIDGRLAGLGATKLLERIECEAYDDEPMDRWAEQVTALIGAPPEPAPSVGHNGGVSTIARPRRVAEPFTRAKPILAPLSRNTVLTAPTSAKEVRQFGFDISEYDVTYAAGDSLGVYATNDPAVVDAWLAAAGLRGEVSVEVDGIEQSLRDALIASYDICRVTPDLLRFVAESCRDPAAAKALRAPQGRLDKWLVGRNGLDIVAEFAVRAEPEQWQEVLVRLTPRNYSISSSPLVSPHEVQLTVSVVRYRGSDGGGRGGVCSTFLADRAAAAPVFLQRSPHFRPPEDAETPMIMVGPGTGIAPFRGFLQERRALGHTGRNWLFFGEQRHSENFYYRDDLEDMVRDGFLNRLDLAFSRDQNDRVYVQHKMGDYGADVWRWLDEGAHFYVCGDATRMAKDVDAALTSIIKTHAAMSDEAAHDYKRELVASKRYVRDVY